MPDSGAYQIILKMNKPIKCKIGALGLQFFPTGIYVYTGSAMKNLHKRVERHLTKQKKIRWHIDYLTTRDEIEILDILTFPSLTREECILNQKLIQRHGASTIVKKFGSSDCKICPTHLLYFGQEFDYKNLLK